MSTGIKNGKLHTNNIFILKLFLLLIVFIIFSGSASALKNEKGRVIVIDAGHGGKDPGAVGSSFSYEKNITLAIALKTGEYIEKNIRNVTVIYTRKNDTFVDIRDRASIANKANADLFISIHANWAKSKSTQRTETFIMGLSKDEQNLEVAMRENEVILRENDYSTKYENFDPKSPESYIMFSLMQNIYKEQSTDLASKIQTQFKEKISRIDRGVKQERFWVLYMTTMPSVLTETGFITNLSEEKYLNSKQGQDLIASAIYTACKDYLNEIDNKSDISSGMNKNPESKPDNSLTVVSPEGEIVFMVQIATFLLKKEVKPGNFNGLTDVVELNTPDNFRYATGSFTDYPAAAKYRKVIETVYSGAFVIAVKDNKILPLQQAIEQKNNK